MKPLFFVIFTLLLYSCSPPIPPVTSVKNTHADSTDNDTNKINPLKADDSPLPPEHYKNKGYEIGFELMDSEKVGGIGIGIAMESVIKILGQPEKKSDTGINQVDGLLSQEWEYKKHGIFLWMEGEKLSKLYVASITLTSPCTLKTRRKIGIGSTSEDVKIAYHKAMDTAENTTHLLIAGSAYGGIQFIIHDNKVDTLFIGASAE